MVQQCSRGLVLTASAFTGFLIAVAQPLPSGKVAGKVIDAATREPIVGVNVYLAGTTLGAATDRDGFFEIRNVPYGSHELIVSMVGYELRVIPLRVAFEAVRLREILIRQKAIELSEVEVTAREPAQWRKQVAKFQAEVLGSTENAKRCRLLNPETLDFEENPREGVLRATARAPIVFENEALGYRVEMVLLGFESSTDRMQFIGKFRFQDLPSESEQRRQQWEESRRRAYFGSLRHFLATLAKGTVREQGFQVRKVSGIGERRRLSFSAGPQVDLASLVFSAEEQFERRLAFERYLEVEYLLEPAEENFRRAFEGFRSSQVGQVSWLEMKSPIVIFNTAGHLANPLSLITYGYWAYERLAEMLPIDYTPE